METRSQKKKRGRRKDREVESTDQTQLLHEAPSIMNCVLPLHSRSTQSLTRDVRETGMRQRGMVTLITDSLDRSYHRRLTEATAGRWRDTERWRNEDDNACGVPYASPVNGTVRSYQQDACRLLSYVTMLLMGAKPHITQTHLFQATCWCVQAGRVYVGRL